MKRILFFLLLIAGSMSVKAQFPTTDSLRAFINRFIRNSAVESFQNLRLNTALIGMTNYLDSAYGGQVVSFTAPNDSTARIVTLLGDTLDVTIRGVGGVTNGDKGDIVVSGGGGTWTIDNNVVNFSKFQQIAGLSVVGNATNSTANVSTITASSDNQVLRRSGTTLGFGAVNLASSNAVTGLLPIANLNITGTPDGTKFLKDNGTWAVPSGGGGSSGLTPTLTVSNIDTNISLQLGYAQAGFQQLQQNSPADTTWSAIGALLYPFRGSDTAVYNPRLFRLWKIKTHRYDLAVPYPNVVMGLAEFGEEAVGKPYMRVGAIEQNWYDNYEYHPVEMKVLGSGSAIRMQSVTMNRTTGSSTWTQRATQHIFSDIADNQMLGLNLGQSTLTAQSVAIPVISLLTNSNDGTNSGLTITTQSGQTIYNWHPSSGSFQNAIFDLPYTWITGTQRGVSSGDPEYDFRFAGRLFSNRMLQFKNGTRINGVFETDADSLQAWVFGGDHILNNRSYSVLAKSLRNNHQKPFAVTIMTNAADTAVWKIPIAIDTVGNVAINMPNPTGMEYADGLLGLTETENHRVYGKSIIVDNTAGLNRLFTLKNTDAGVFSGPSMKFFNDVGTSGTNGYGIEFYSSNTTAPYTNAAVHRNYEGGPIIMFGSTAELARFNDNGNTGLGGITSPTARLHLPAGTATANTAPLKINSGTNLTTPEDGAIEYNGTHFYATIGSTRYQLDQQGGGSGITSINSQTGSTQTIAAGAGISVNSSSNTHTISVPTTFITSGTYTPTLTNESNITSSTAYQCQYYRVGNVVTVSGKITIDYTSTGLSSVGISLPIASSISNDYEVAGTANAETNNGARIQGDATNDRAQFYINTPSSAGYDYFFVFTYQVL